MSSLHLKILKLEEEYNSSFKDIIKSYADAGHSKHDTANILEITDSAFNRIVKEMNWNSWFKRYSIAMKQAYEDRKGIIGTPKEANKAIFNKHAFEYQGIVDTIAGHARRFGITYHQARYRHSIGVPLEVKPSTYRKDGYWSWK